MARSVAALCAVVLCAAFALASATNSFIVTGNVYCDTCHAGFPTRASFGLQDAKVAVVCKKDGKQTFYGEAKTDVNGDFKIQVQGEREQESCMANALSGTARCPYGTDSKQGPVYLTHNNGIPSDERKTGPFAFRPQYTLNSCTAVMAEYNIYSDDSD